MDEGWEDPERGSADEPAGSATVMYRGPQTQREVDAIFARLRAWRDRSRSA